MNVRNLATLALSVTFLGTAPIGCAVTSDGSASQRVVRSIDFGNGTASAYAEFDTTGAPAAIGVAFSANALDGLPGEPSDLRSCYDRDEDGVVDQTTECVNTHGFVIPMPDAVAAHSDIPFGWLLLSWNPVGHIPPGIYDVPHFDIHFVIESIENIFALHPGPCGPELMDCAQFEVARRPLPPNYMHSDFQDVEAVVPSMGNHLIDLTSPEFQGEDFTRTWIYGVYDGEVTFYEEMLTRAYILSGPNTCFPIKAPAAVGLSGYYPTQSCTRHDVDTGEYTVSIEGFELREASEPEPLPESM